MTSSASQTVTLDSLQAVLFFVYNEDFIHHNKI